MCAPWVAIFYAVRRLDPAHPQDRQQSLPLLCFDGWLRLTGGNVSPAWSSIADLLEEHGQGDADLVGLGEELITWQGSFSVEKFVSYANVVRGAKAASQREVLTQGSHPWDGAWQPSQVYG